MPHRDDYEERQQRWIDASAYNTGGMFGDAWDDFQKWRKGIIRRNLFHKTTNKDWEAVVFVIALFALSVILPFLNDIAS